MSWFDKLSCLLLRRPSLLTLLCLRLQNYSFFFNCTIIHTFSCSFCRFFNISLRLTPLTHLPKERKTRKLLPDDTNPLCLARHVPVYAKIVSSEVRKRPYMILIWHEISAAKSVMPSRCWFYAGFSSIFYFLCIILIFSRLYEIKIFSSAFRSLKTVQNASKIVNLGSSTSQSCSPK